MRQALDLASFTKAPIGQWISIRTAMIWCESSTLAGAVCWGRPNADDTREVLAVLEHYESLAPSFDIILDAGRLEEVDPAGFDVLLEWSRTHRDMMRAHIRRRISVVPSGLAGFALAGISVAAGGLDDVQLAPNARAGFEMLRPGEGDALHDEVETIVSRLGASPGFLLELRAQLYARSGDLTLESAAKVLSLSTRSLQRRLAEAGTSFRNEVQDARFRAARDMLASSDGKLAAIADKLAITETALAALVRARTQLTVAEFRRRLRED